MANQMTILFQAPRLPDLAIKFPLEILSAFEFMIPNPLIFKQNPYLLLVKPTPIVVAKWTWML